MKRKKATIKQDGKKGKKTKKPVKRINPYSDPKTAELNANWIKYVAKRRPQERTSVAKSFVRIRDDLSLLRVRKGGDGSGNFGHAGRPGKVGGSAPRSGATHTSVGITPYHETRPLSVNEVNDRGEKLVAELKNIDTVSNVVYNGVGEGGWEGGAEPTLIVSYDGNGKAIKLIARYGKEWGQDGVLLRKRASNDDPSAQPAFTLTFDGSLGDEARAAVEKAAVAFAKKVYGEPNIGWTWWQENGRTIFDSQSISQWGGDAAKHMEIADGLSRLFDNATMTVEYNQIGIMENDPESDKGYEKIISGADPYAQ